MASPSGDGIASTARPNKLTSTAKINQLEEFTVRVPLDGTRHTSIFSNTPVDNLDTSMRAGVRGPTSIDDPVARERISHFDHERIPERAVHARGVGAHGSFKLHTSLSEYTDAKILTEVGNVVSNFVRFSTVLGSSGAAETAREVRGFAVRFYTQQGNWDIVGNNIPIFFIQDGVKFVDLIHAGKPEPQLAMPQAQTAHDSFWDFISLSPESTAMIAWILSDATLPRSYRMMPGYGVNTFVLVKGTKRTFVKFHWKPHEGAHSLVWDEALKLGGQDPDFLRRDLSEAIEAGSYPKWELGVQLVAEEDEHNFAFDLLDCTKLIPEELVPIKWVGTMTLDRNPTNYFAETEQVAFCSSNIVPGIDFSNDPMLQLRNFSYFDTQLSRLGGPNFASLPINRSICPFISTARDGHSQHRIPAGPHYYPNRFEVPTAGTKDGRNYVSTDEDAIAHAANVDKETMQFAPYKVEGIRAKQRPAKFNEFYSQAQLFYNSQTDAEKKHMVQAASFELGKVASREIQEKMMERFVEIDYDFAKEIGLGFGLVPSTPKNPNHGKSTSGVNPVSLASPQNTFSAATRKVAVFVLDGFDSTQTVALIAGLKTQGVVIQLVGSRKGPAYPSSATLGDTTSSGVIQMTDFTIETCRSTHFDALCFPSGNESYVKSLEQGRVVHFAREAFGHFKSIAACGVAVPWLAHKCLPGCLDLKADATKTFTSNLGLVLGSNLTDADTATWKKITKGPVDAVNFVSSFVEAIAAHRHWDRDISSVAF